VIVGQRTGRVAVPLRERDLDHQNHVYHGVMLTLLDEGRVRFYADHLGIEDAASYVVVRVELDYHTETVLADGPLSIEFAVERAGTTSLRTIESVMSASGRRVATAVITCVLWDPESRMPRPLTAAERERLERFMALPAPDDLVDVLETER